MSTEIIADNFTDQNGNPSGGYVKAIGIDIEWQNGPLGRDEKRIGPTGAFVENVIQAALQRLEYYQKSKFNCRENALAITKLEEALHWLQSRTAKREQRKVEGTHEV